MSKSGRIYLGVGTLAAAALVFESTLTRLLAVAQFYHFAFLVVSLALLGFGAGGSILSLFPGWYLTEGKGRDEEKLHRLLAISGVGFAASILIGYGVVSFIPFDSYSIAWDTRQIYYFAGYYLALTIPFIFVGLGIGAALTISSRKSNLVYAVNLLGSALGVILAIAIMQLAGVPGGVLSSGLIGLSTTLLSITNGSYKVLKRLCWLLLASGCVYLGVVIWMNLGNNAPLGVTISEYKGLAHALRIPGSEQLFGRWNAISRLDVIAGAKIRVMPGLSYMYPDYPPEQNALALDADALQPVTLISAEEFDAAAYLPEAFAFQIRPYGEVLVLEPGGGLGILQALAGSMGRVTAVATNPLVLEAVSTTTPDIDVYEHPRVEVMVESTRVYLNTPGKQFDIIFLPLTDPYRPVASGAYSLAETYDLTVDSFEDMIARLSQNGLLTISRWLQTPPSEALRLIATVIEALESAGIDQPRDKIIAYRGIQTMTIILKPDGWTKSELSQVREFCDTRHYDLVWAPNLTTDELNRFNQLPDTIYYDNVRDLLTISDRESFYKNYPFAIQPPTDDHPFFFHFFKWEQTPEILATIGHVWQPFGGSGYFVLIALFILVSGFSLVLIILPLVVNRRITSRIVVDDKDVSVESLSTWRVFLYFGCIGLAYLFIEIPLIQKGILFLEHPTYAFTFVVLIILISSSLGSFLSRKVWLPRTFILVVLIVLAILTPVAINQFQDSILGWSLLPRSIIFAICLIPLGFAMGIPFPSGLAWLEQSKSKLVPWAWAVNGCASVMASVLAAILALSYGFTMVLFLGAGFYGLAVVELKPWQFNSAS